MLTVPASVASLRPRVQIAVESEPVEAWIAVGGVVAVFAAMLVGVVLYRPRTGR